MKKSKKCQLSVESISTLMKSMYYIYISMYVCTYNSIHILTISIYILNCITQTSLVYLYL
jgi:hypothetical protein